MFKPETMFTNFTPVDIFSQKIEIKEEPTADNEEFDKKPYSTEYKPLEIGYTQSENKIEVKEESIEDYNDIDNWNSLVITKNESGGLAKCVENIDVGKYEFLAIDDCKTLSNNNLQICRDNFEIDIKEEEAKVYDPQLTCNSLMTRKNIEISKDEECTDYPTNYPNETDINKRYNCEHCEYKTTTKRLLSLHSKNKHSKDGKKFKCSQCCYETNYKRGFNRHVTKHLSSNDKEFKCSHCAYQTNVKRYLKAHIRIRHSDLNKYKCQICEYETNRPADMKQHLSIHDAVQGDKDNRNFHCTFCSYKTYRKTTLTTHLKNKHSVGESKDFKCPECPYETNFKKCLDIHLVKHLTSTDKKFKCSDCNYQTNIETYFKTHVRYKHGNIEQQQCPKCEYKSNFQYRIKEHLLTHVDVRSYECKICSKRFKLSHHLVSHSLVHSEKRFCCERCDYKSNYKSDLLRHKNIHIRQKGMI